MQAIFSLATLDFGWSIYGRKVYCQPPIFSSKVSMEKNHFFSYSLFLSKCLYIKNKYEVLRIILLGFYREKSLFQVLEFSQIGQKSQKAGGYRKNFSV